MSHLEGRSDGSLIIIGGAEDRTDTCLILREFVRRAGGIKAHIVVIPAATSYQQEAGDDYTRLFKSFGAETVQAILTKEREDADKYEALEAIAQATGIFFTGGDQARAGRVDQEGAVGHLRQVFCGDDPAGVRLEPHVKADAVAARAAVRNSR